ncbi:MAG: galactarate dehydratase [Proteobacteria bacterium]|nr:galactarate dehydratase [Pseudomonadota bacterium]
MVTAICPIVLRVHADDNVAAVGNSGGLPAGTVLPDGIILRRNVPQGHKVALRDIGVDEPILRYRAVIGHATRDIARGDWVDGSALRMPAPPSLDDLPHASGKVAALPPLRGHTFEGYRNADGTVGTRNLLAIGTTVQCVAGVVDHAARRIREELLPRYRNVDDVVALDHVYGCGVAIDAPGAEIPIRTLRNILRNPNFGGAPLLVGLGCEKLQPDRLAGTALTDLPLVRLQDESHTGFASMITAILEAADRRLAQLDTRRRETCPVSDLVVGVQCGGSDALSGMTANPAVGVAVDLLVRAGATAMFSEITEVRDGIAQLTARAATPEVADALIREMRWYDAYLERGGVDRSANTTPGNKAGGLANIVEKAMGSIVKSGTAPIAGVVPAGERADRKGLLFVATPASDFVCGTLQLAAGMTLHVFTTGRGTPYGLAAVPVIKVATHNALAERWHDLIDLNAGTIATGEASVEDVGQSLFALMLDVASGRIRSRAEGLRLHNALAVFNPAPVT